MGQRMNTGAPAVVVTGVSSGIGLGTARVLAATGCRVFGSVRKPEDAKRLSNELGGSFTPLLFDVTNEKAVKDGAAAVREKLKGEKLAALVNNAGIAVPGPLLEIPVSELRRQLEVNLVSVLSVTQAFFPLLATRKDGGARPARIINISSVAGRLALPFLGPYAASKHGMEGLSDSLRRECLLYGVDVIVIDPGSVATAIWEKADALDLSPFERSPYLTPMTRLRDSMVSSGRRGSSPERVGLAVLKVLQAAHPRPRVTVGSGNLLILMSRFLGKRTLDRMIGRTLGLSPARA